MPAVIEPLPAGSEERLLEVFVAQALDDLEERRLDTTTTLRLIGHQSWWRGYRYAARR